MYDLIYNPALNNYDFTNQIHRDKSKQFLIGLGASLYVGYLDLMVGPYIITHGITFPAKSQNSLTFDKPEAHWSKLTFNSSAKFNKFCHRHHLPFTVSIAEDIIAGVLIQLKEVCDTPDPISDIIGEEVIHLKPEYDISNNNLFKL